MSGRCELYEFAIVALLGIAVFRLLAVAGGYGDLSKVGPLVTIGLSALLAWGLGFSVFENWGVDVRSEAMAYIGTGLMIAAAGYAAPQVFDRVGDVVGRRRETKVSRAA